MDLNQGFPGWLAAPLLAIGFAIANAVKPPKTMNLDFHAPPPPVPLSADRFAGLPPWGFWLALVSVMTGVIASFVRVTIELESLKGWVATAEGSRFTNRDWFAARNALDKDLAEERAYSRTICRELARLQRELDKVPAVDCTAAPATPPWAPSGGPASYTL